ncbi:nucleotide exchange factor GrpE [Trichococcus shcherbakoviae]|uniref:Protein GrpE n=1 Tax=Trichococcus shcherbakoviae subsp. psychrophilus TaxID=2585775 RepID=A0A5C5E7X6_9LACT|nr:nucleotide exchange factor GrpE [Trichococcus shcherbakoviae]TNV69122.1 nucleotide exchange factor GrpE [Trichococcus shcherbakoviae subsp. psychrophilus]
MDNNEELVDQEQATVDTTVVEGQETVAEASEVETLKATLSETEDRLLRLQAELANIQKRNAKERQDAAKYRSQSLAQELLPVMDSLERALEIEVEDEKSLNLKKGLEMVMNLFTDAFAKEGITSIDPIGQPFDPNFHQSIQVLPATEGQAPDTVVAVFQKGYALKERVLRPAMVVVSQ